MSNNSNNLHKDSNNLNKDIATVMRDAYLEYTFMVAEDRAIASVMDGLKPVQRRIIYIMHENNNVYNRPFKKSVNTVGITMSVLHPHGNDAIYDAMVNLKREFVMLYPLIDGQGNFGSFVDRAAAMRYTEARLSLIANEFFINKSHTRANIDNVVPTKPNFDDTTTEPCYLPAKIPALFLNGVNGIAVGISTRIPPHNLRELCSAINAVLYNTNITVDELMEKHIYGPDFPMGDTVSSPQTIREMYETGKGKLTLTGNYHFENDCIVFTSVPFQTSVLNIIERIKALIDSKRLNECVWVRDETNKHGMRIVIKLTSEQHKYIMLNILLQQTPLRSTYAALCYALDENNQVQIYNLKNYINNFIKMQHQTLIQQATYDCTIVKRELHILIGKMIALNNINEIIDIMKNSATKEMAADKLTAKEWKITSKEMIDALKLPSHNSIKFSPEQLNSILNMRLRDLVSITYQEIVDNMYDCINNISTYEKIIYKEEHRKEIISKDLHRISETYGKDRQSKIENNTKNLTSKDFVISKNNLIILSNDQFIKKVSLTEFHTQHRSGVGKQGGKEVIEQAMIANDRDTLLFFSSKGIVYSLDCFKISLTAYANRGRFIMQLLPVLENTNDKIIEIQNISENEQYEFIMFIFETGYVRKNYAKDFLNIRSNGKIYNKSDSKIINILMCNAGDHVMMATKLGQVIVLEVNSFRTMQQHTSHGIIGAKLKKGDHIIKSIIVKASDMILSIMNNGFGRISNIDEYKVRKNRGSIGISNINAKQRQLENTMADIISIDTQNVTKDSTILILTSSQQIIRIPLTDIKESSRTTRGTKLLNNKDKICFSALIE